MKKITSRNFTVDYYEKEEGIWLVKTHLLDDAHEIEVNAEINMADMVITDTEILFKKQPLEQCKMVEALASRMKGIKIDHNFSKNMLSIFMGAEGCPNIMSLLTISIPGIIYYYYPYLMRTGKMKHEEWDHMMRTDLKDACLGHTLRNQNV